MSRRRSKSSKEEETTGLFDFSDDDDEKNFKDKEKKSLYSDDDEDVAIDAGLKPDDDDELDDDDDDDDSDSAPEDVSFHAGKESALQQIRTAMASIREEKTKIKDKRKKKLEVFEEQKKKRLEYLQKRRLPDDVIASINTPPARVKKAKVEREIESEDESEDESESAAVDEDEEVVINPRLLEGADFLPFDGSQRPGISVATLKAVSRVKSASESAWDFKNKALYGGRIKRQSAVATAAIREKRKLTKRPLTAR